MFSRKSPEAKVIQRTPTALSRDDELYIVRTSRFHYAYTYLSPDVINNIFQNTQSGSQWDGLKHFGVHGAHNIFYQK